MASSSQSSSDGVMPSIIIGGGRVGQALFDMGVDGDVIVKRGDAFPSSPATGPIYVCTRNDALQGVVDATPEARRKDLVFLQNGMLQPWLDARGLGGNTQALVYFAVAKMNEKPTDGITDANPEGLTAANGEWADAFAARLRSGGLRCHVLDDDAFRASMFEKLIWICAFMGVGAAHPGATVGDVESAHKEEVEALIAELVAGSESAKGVRFAEGTIPRLAAYARAGVALSDGGEGVRVEERVLLRDQREGAGRGAVGSVPDAHGADEASRRAGVTCTSRASRGAPPCVNTLRLLVSNLPKRYGSRREPNP